MALQAVFSFIRLPRTTLFLLYWCLSHYIVSLYYWWTFLWVETSLLGSTIALVYAICLSTGAALYLFGASACWMQVYRFGHEMLPNERRRRITLGFALIYFPHILPCWIVEAYLVHLHGFLCNTQCLCFIISTVTWITFSMCIWLSYTWFMARFLNFRFGDHDDNETMAGSDTDSIRTESSLRSFSYRPVSQNRKLDNF